MTGADQKPSDPDRTGVTTPYGVVDTLRGGTGPDLVLLHDDTGREPWGELHRALAGSFRVHAPSMPGWDESPGLDWVRDVRQLALVMAGYLRSLGDGPVHLVGRGLGAWVAAELLLSGADRVETAVLVAPFGVRPPTGSYVDQFLISSTEWVQLSFSSDAAFLERHGEPAAEASVDGWERNRESTTRVTWRPYLYDQALPHLLAGVRAPVLVVAATRDRIVPPSVPVSIAQIVPGAGLVTVDGGHALDVEQPAALAATVTEFVSQHLVSTS